MNGIKFVRCLVMAIACFFGVAQGAASDKDWDPFFKALATDTFSDKNTYGGGFFSSGTTYSNDFSTSSKNDLQNFLQSLIEKLTIKPRGILNVQNRADLTWQQISNLVTVLSDATITQKFRNATPNISILEKKHTRSAYFFKHSSMFF